MNFDKDQKEGLNEKNLEETQDNIENENEEGFSKGLFRKKKQEETSDSDNLELDKALKENEELSTRLLRLQADFLNYKKRVEKEKLGLVDYGVETLALEILPMLDNFERALEAEDDKESQFYKGVEMIYDGIIGVLDKNDIKEIESLEKPFDPDYHHAVGMEDTDEYDKDTVIRILQKGYIMKDKVIRPTMVIVSK